MCRWQIGYDYDIYVYRDTTSAEIMKPRTMRQLASLLYGKEVYVTRNGDTYMLLEVVFINVPM